jgi:hypothetical protein
MRGFGVSLGGAQNSLGTRRQTSLYQCQERLLVGSYKSFKANSYEAYFASDCTVQEQLVSIDEAAKVGS